MSTLLRNLTLSLIFFFGFSGTFLNWKLTWKSKKENEKKKNERNFQKLMFVFQGNERGWANHKTEIPILCLFILLLPITDYVFEFYCYLPSFSLVSLTTVHCNGLVNASLMTVLLLVSRKMAGFRLDFFSFICPKP